jgi:hypothetical protein
MDDGQWENVTVETEGETPTKNREKLWPSLVFINFAGATAQFTDQ